MSGITQFGYIEFEVSDPSAWATFTTKALGLELSRELPGGGFSARHDSHRDRVYIRPGEADDVCTLGFEVADEATLDALVAKLRGADVEVTEGDAALREYRGVARVVSFREPGGVTCELHVGPTMAERPFESKVYPGGFVAEGQGFGHLALRANDMAESERFFCDVLGAKLSDRIQCRIGRMDIDITFLHFGDRHHSVALGAGLPKHIHHFMLQLADMSDLGRAMDRVVDHGGRIHQTLGQHPNDKMMSFYAETPSGFHIELGWGGRTITPDWQPVTHDIWTEWGHRPPQMFVPKASH